MRKVRKKCWLILLLRCLVCRTNNLIQLGAILFTVGDPVLLLILIFHHLHCICHWSSIQPLCQYIQHLFSRFPTAVVPFINSVSLSSSHGRKGFLTFTNSIQESMILSCQPLFSTVSFDLFAVHTIKDF